MKRKAVLPKAVPMRLPRPFSKRLAKALNEMWRIPKFKVRCANEYTKFEFRLPYSIPIEFQRRDLVGFSRLFPLGTKGWASVLVKAYGTSLRDDKPIKKEFGSLLREVVVRALQILLEEHKDRFHQDESKVTEEKTSLRAGVIKTGPAIDERKRIKTAIRLAKRYKELLPQVKEIRRFIEQSESSLKDSELRAAIDRTFQYSWIKFITNGCALNNLLPIPGHDARVETISIEQWTARQLRVGIIVCEELATHPEARLGPTTVYEKYILPGNELILNNQ